MKEKRAINMIPILVTQHAHERRYIKYKRQHSVDEFLKNIDFHKKMNHAVILFGSCGALDIMDQYNHLISPYHWHNQEGDIAVSDDILPIAHCGSGYTSDYSVHNPLEAIRIKFEHRDCMIVDQESANIAKICFDNGIPFQSIRYVIDGCHRRIIPKGINHFWRKFQHRRMQLKMDRLLMGAQ